MDYLFVRDLFIVAVLIAVTCLVCKKSCYECMNTIIYLAVKFNG